MRIALAQLNPTIGDLKQNERRILAAIEQAKERGAELVLFPELTITGCPPEDFILQAHFFRAVIESLERIVPVTKGIMAVVGTVRRGLEERLFNSALVLIDGHFMGYQDKILLSSYDVYSEERYFCSGKKTQIWPFKGKKVAITLGEDIWQHGGGIDLYSRDPIAELASSQLDLLLNLSASPFSPGRVQLRTALCQKVAETLKCPVALCNQVGGNGSLIFDGHSLAVNAEGTMIGLAKGFAKDLLLVDTEAKQAVRPAVSGEEELYKALVLGVRDYFYKSGFRKACLGLSGGIDSALVACLAVEALGAENVLGVAMPSRYSSDRSLLDAQELASCLGIELRTIPIEGAFQNYLQLLEPEWHDLPVDATEENLQARIRGTILMALANKLGHVVLATGNKSELAMGYSTLYGDMVGGLGVIADLTKRQVYSLAKWINKSSEIIPAAIMHKPPSAELRPGQLDTDSLPPYEVVDSVLQHYLAGQLSPQEIASKFGYAQELVDSLIGRIHQHEYKRRQASPCLRVSQDAFNLDRRFPIVQKWV